MSRKTLSFEFRGARFAAWEQGRGTAVIFLHGFLEDSSMWQPLCEALPSRFRKIALDLPGHGQSGNLSYVHRMEDMAELVRALLRHLRLRKVHLVGHSMGGYAALAFAEKYPDLLRSIVLLNSTAYADSPERQAMRERAILLVKRNPSSFVRSAIPLLFAAKNRKRLKAEIAKATESAQGCSPQGILAALEGMKLRADREVILHFGPNPVLLVAAREDPVIPFVQSAKLAKAPRVETLFLPDGHMSHLEAFEPLLTGLQSFLKKHNK